MTPDNVMVFVTEMSNTPADIGMTNVKGGHRADGVAVQDLPDGVGLRERVWYPDREDDDHEDQDIDPADLAGDSALPSRVESGTSLR
jgi:hypothetical protein